MHKASGAEEMQATTHRTMCTVCVFLLKSLHNSGVSHVYLLIAGAGGGELLAGIRRIQISPESRERARDGETSEPLTHHLYNTHIIKIKHTLLFASVLQRSAGVRQTLTMCSLGSRLQSANVSS